MRATLTNLLIISGLAASSASAASLFTLHTSRASWEAAVSGFSTETFNSYVSDTSADNVTFNGFTMNMGPVKSVFANNLFVDVPSYEYTPGAATIDGTPRLNFAALFSATMTFTSPVTAVGFDTVNYDLNDDSYQILLDGFSLFGGFPSANQQVGFWGITSNFGSTLTSITIAGSGDPEGVFNAIDNVSLVTTNDVPFGVDSTLGLGLLGAAAAFKFRRRKA